MIVSSIVISVSHLVGTERGELIIILIVSLMTRSHVCPEVLHLGGRTLHHLTCIVALPCVLLVAP